MVSFSFIGRVGQQLVVPDLTHAANTAAYPGDWISAHLQALMLSNFINCSFLNLARLTYA
jgi:hypothetical protein